MLQVPVVAPVLGESESPQPVPPPEPPAMPPATQTDIDEQEQAIAGTYITFYTWLFQRVYSRARMI